ncbi:protein CrtK-like [Cylas formicarius]|uniref:protein CrtK-like n=1 Tax=Cylas formicarius TaxID=197179 RepID=UPI002958910D|nr:protein CrtK-like [Cylas formicarius]
MSHNIITVETYPERLGSGRFKRVCIILIAFYLPQIGGGLGALVTKDSIDGWYQTLNKPSWTPPTWLFMPMWIFLYSLLGIASYMTYVFGNGLGGAAKWPIIIYVCNLVLNWLWSPVFFGTENILAGLVLIATILLSAVLTAVLFARVYWVLGLLLLPYVVWLTVATALNAWIYVNN